MNSLRIDASLISDQILKWFATSLTAEKSAASDLPLRISNGFFPMTLPIIGIPLPPLAPLNAAANLTAQYQPLKEK
jgi:hypothetical protein